LRRSYQSCISTT